MWSLPPQFDCLHISERIRPAKSALYRLSNQLIEILVTESYFVLAAVHRLDRLTSGVLILGRSAQIAANMMKQIQENQVRKTYIARVRGRFPEYVAFKKIQGIKNFLIPLNSTKEQNYSE